MSSLFCAFAEDMQYLTKNFNFITQEFLKGRTQRRLKQPHRLRMKREVIKIMDSSTQTDTVETDAKLPHPEFLELQEKYEVVKHELKKMKLVLKSRCLLPVVRITPKCFIYF